MFDTWLRPRIDPALNAVGRRLARAGISANQVTLIGLALGLAAAGLAAMGAPGWAIGLPMLAGRMADGIDGAVARAAGKTDFGGYLDILADFAFYGAFPLAFALRDPADNGLAAAVLLFAFYVNGAGFLAYASLAASRGMTSAAQGEKSLYFQAGLMEGAETIGFFTAFCLWPGGFAALALVFAGLCGVTVAGRLRLAFRVFR